MRAGHCESTASTESPRTPISVEDAVARTVTVITALAPVIGYAPAAKLAKEALATGEMVADLVTKQGLLGADELEAVLKPSRLTGIPADPEIGQGRE